VKQAFLRVLPTKLCLVLKVGAGETSLEEADLTRHAGILRSTSIGKLPLQALPRREEHRQSHGTGDNRWKGVEGRAIDALYGRGLTPFENIPTRRERPSSHPPRRRREGKPFDRLGSGSSKRFRTERSCTPFTVNWLP